MRPTSMMAVMAVAFGLVFTGTGFAQSTANTTTTEKPDGQKSSTTTTSDPSKQTTTTSASNSNGQVQHELDDPA